MKKLLIVENDTATLEVVSILMGYSGFEVIPSETKIQVHEIAVLNPNIIVIDYMLNGSYGSELCLEIKSNPLTKQIPVVLFSASHNLEQIAQDCHADAFISKPFDLTEFEQLINKLTL